MQLLKRSAVLLTAMMLAGSCAFAQQDSVNATRNQDTIRVGGIVILKRQDTAQKRVRVIVSDWNNHHKKENVRTSFLFVDLGFSNWADKTDYAGATAGNSLVNEPGQSALSKKDFNLRTIKSINVNIWLAGQTVNLVKHYLNLKYAIGLELNNYRFDSDVSFSDGGFNPYDPNQDIPHGFAYHDSKHFTKNKLAADYLTVPVMLGFQSNPRNSHSRRGIMLSGGVSMGYLYSSRTKQKSAELGKVKDRGNFDLRKWKFAYVGDIGISTVHFYGSYSPKSMFENDLNFHPFTLGIRLYGNW